MTSKTLKLSTVTKPFKAWVYQAAKVSQLFRFDYNDMISRNGGRPMMNALVLMLKSLGFHLRSSMIRVIYVYLKKTSSLVKSQGFEGTVIYLKACYMQLIHSIAGYKPKVSASKCRISTNGVGLPRIIPLIHRRRIRLGDERILKLGLSLFSLYRVFNYISKPKLSTITGDSSFSSRSEAQRKSIISRIGNGDFISFFGLDFLKMPFEKFGKRGISSFDPFTDILSPILGYGISKSGPFTRDRLVNTSLESLVSSAKVYSHPYFNQFLRSFEIFCKDNKNFLMYLIKYSHLVDKPKLAKSELFFIIKGQASLPNPVVYPVPKNGGTISKLIVYEKFQLLFGPVLGKLGLKQEAAGKVRVFAMVDAGTQFALKPLHDYLFRLLRPIPMDGTFDQMEVVRTASKIRNKKFFSFDLSAATDRLPLQLQIRILSAFFGTHRALAGADVLVGRSYYLEPMRKNALKGIPKIHSLSDDSLKSIFSRYFYRYKVGQPMGALSSGAMLAITHHFILQYCGWSLSNRSVFKDYRVLGDDVLIFNRAVAKRYQEVMKILGLEINLSKSVISNNCFEFAKRIVYKGKDISPLSLKEINGVGENLLSLASFRDKWDISFPASLSFISAGYRSLGSFLDKNIRAANPKLRISLLFGTRSRCDPLDGFLLYSSRRRGHLPEGRDLFLAEEITVLYKNVIVSIIEKKKKTAEQMQRKYNDSPLIHEVGFANAYDGLERLDTVLQGFNAMGRLPRFASIIQHAGSINNHIETLRRILSFVCSCPDFSSSVIRKLETEDGDVANMKLKEVFCQEVGIGMSINSLIVGHGYPLTPVNEKVVFDETKFRHGSTKEILLDLLNNLRSYKIVRLIWKKVSVPILYVKPFKSRGGNIRPLKVVKYLPSDFFKYSYPYSYGLKSILSYIGKVSLPTKKGQILTKYRFSSIVLPIPYIDIRDTSIIEGVKAFIVFLILGILLLIIDPMELGRPSPLVSLTELVGSTEENMKSLASHIQSASTYSQTSATYFRDWGIILSVFLLFLLLGYSTSVAGPFIKVGFRDTYDRFHDSGDKSIYHGERSDRSNQSIDPFDEPSWWSSIGNIVDSTKAARVRKSLEIPLPSSSHRDWGEQDMDGVPTDGTLMTDSSYIENPDFYHGIGIFDTDTDFTTSWGSNSDMGNIILLRNGPDLGDTGNLIYELPMLLTEHINF